MCFSGEKGGGGLCEKKKKLYVKKMLFMKKQMCANKEHGRKLCIASSCSGVHRRISMKKPMDSYFK
jgi:hypothetical protein